MRDNELYAQVLGIKSPWQVANVDLGLSKGEVSIYLELDKSIQSCCSVRSAPSPGYDTREQRYRHLDEVGMREFHQGQR